MNELRSKPTRVVGEAGIATYCSACLRRLNRGLRKNDMPAVEPRPCLRGEHFACFGCAGLFDGVVIQNEEA